jgi:hypothetical protein
MAVLGRDGSDYFDLKMAASKPPKKNSSKNKSTRNDENQEEKQQALLLQEPAEEFHDELVTTPAREENKQQPRRKKKVGRSWWKKGLDFFSSSNKDNDDNDNELGGDEYANMEHSEEVLSPQHHRSYDEEEPPVYYQEHESPRRSTTATMHRSLLRNLPLPATKEEDIQRDCSFLYRPVSENLTLSHPARRRPSPSRRSRGLRDVLDRPPRGVSTLYRDAQDILSPPAMANFQAKYQQLNQEFEFDDHDRYEDYNDYIAPQDLTLEEGQQQRERHTLVTDTATQSSLFVQHETTGRVELRLPRDHVRLMVDPNMEPGILSVVQCRHPEDPPQTLEYCLTVPPNLYQRVVSEMTHYSNHWSTGAGLESSFYASEHMDIKVAIAVLFLVFLMLGIQTLIWPVD